MAPGHPDEGVRTVADAITLQPPVQELILVNQQCRHFDRLWQQGQRPVIEDHVGSVAEHLRLRLRDELIRAELEWRFRAGECPAADEYRDRYGDCSAWIGGWVAEARESAAALSRLGAGEVRPRASRPPGAGGERATETPASPPVAGETPRFLGEYELLECLGAGAMGEVWKARHQRLARLVALKVLKPLSGDAEDARARFVREMRVAGSIDHPNLVDTRDAGEHGGVVYIVMKLIPGKDLARVVAESGRLPVAEACEIARQVATGLGHLAERGLVHRDIKPGNIMLTPEGQVKILDLGLARWWSENADGAGEDLTAEGQMLGTPDYLAPEQLNLGAPVDIRADLYGLGGTLFFLLTGRAPFAHHKKVSSKLHAARQEQPPEVRTLRPEVPPALAELVAQLLAKRPADRPQTPKEVAAALGPFAGENFSMQPTILTRSEPSRRPAKRRLWVAAAVGAAVLVAVLGPALWLLAPPRSRPGPAGVVGEGLAGPAVPAQLRVSGLDVRHIANLRGEGHPRGILGEQSFSARAGDEVTVEAKLSRPAYAYLIAFRPDGTEDLCFPEGPDEAPPPTDRPRFPSKSQGKVYALDDGEGLEVFVVVASDRPLPPYKQWRSQRKAAPWKREPAPANVVWWYDGKTVVDQWGDVPRGPRDAAGRGPVVTLTDWFRDAAGIDAVGAVGFGVLPGEKP
jgi:serine/threonine protein kinase